jgi:hypothetical protein
MATSVASGSWSATATWGGAIPANNESVTIAHAVTYDANMLIGTASVTGLTITNYDATTNTLTISGAAWAENAQQGKGLLGTSGDISGISRRVLYNDATTLVVDIGFTGTVSGCTCDLYTEWAAGVAITINNGGSLTASTASGSYHLRCSGNIVVNSGGSLLAGTSTSVPYPADCSLTINQNAKQITGAGTVKMYCTEPTIKTAKLNAATTTATADIRTVSVVASADGQTIDVTNIWKKGWAVNLVDSATNWPDSETRYVLSTSSNTLVMNSSITKGKDSIVFLRHRNITLYGASYSIYANTGTVEVAACIHSASNSGVYNIVNAKIVGGVIADIAGTGSCANACSNLTVDDCILGKAYVHLGNYFTAKNCFFLANSAYVGSYYYVKYINCYFLGNNGGHYAASDIVADNCVSKYSTNFINLGTILLSSCVLSSHNYDVNAPMGKLYNCLLGSTNENTNYATYCNDNYYLESFDHDQSPGAYKSWTVGGITTYPLTATPPTGYTSYYSTTLGSATRPSFYQISPINLPVSGTLRYIVYLRKSASMTYLPRVHLFNPTTDPLISTTYTPLVEVIMTDSTDTWEKLTVTYTNTTTYTQNLILRIIGKNATGTMLSLPIQIQLRESWG